MQSHTILGSKTQRGLTQMALDILFQSTDTQLVQPTYGSSVFPSLAGADVSEAQLFPAATFLDSLYGDNQSERGFNSRAQTPMPVCPSFHKQIWTYIPTPTQAQLNILHPSSLNLYPSLSQNIYSRTSTGVLSPQEVNPYPQPSIRPITGGMSRVTRSVVKMSSPYVKEYSSFLGTTATRQRNIPRPSTFPQAPAVQDIVVPVDPNAEYAIVVSMYEVYNDRIFDLLIGSATGSKNGAQKRRALLFKSTEQSPDRKVVAGLRKIVCGSLEEALMVLETGLVERRVAGTGSNAVSSRSHGFFCVEVKKRNKSRRGPWTASTLTIVDLAGNLYLLSQDGGALIRYDRIRACEARKDCRGYTC